MRENIGYYEYAVPLTARTALLSACIRQGIEFYREREAEDEFRFRIPLYRDKAARTALTDAGIPYRKSKLRGICGTLRDVVRHPGIVAGLFLSLFLYIWLGGMVWEVRIVAREEIDEDAVLAVLKESGLDEGRRIRDVDIDAVCAAYLQRDTGMAFAAVHMRGVVAEVELIRKDVGGKPETPAPPCNIVASRDALITDVTVYEGKSHVRIGQTVKAGDILVTGVISDVGGSRILGAAADVRGQVEEKLCVEIPTAYERRTVTAERLRGFSLTVFGHTFTFGQTGENTDAVQPGDVGTVTEKKRCYLFGRIRLPVMLTVSREVVRGTETAERTPEECRAVAEVRMRERVMTAIGDGALTEYSKSGEVTDTGYRLTCRIVYESNIAKSLAITVENK